MDFILEMGLILELVERVFEQNKNSVFDLIALQLEMGLILDRPYVRIYTVFFSVKLIGK